MGANARANVYISTYVRRGRKCLSKVIHVEILDFLFWNFYSSGVDNDEELKKKKKKEKKEQ